MSSLVSLHVLYCELSRGRFRYALDASNARKKGCDPFMEFTDILLSAITVSDFNARKDLSAGTEDAGI